MQRTFYGQEWPSVARKLAVLFLLAVFGGAPRGSAAAERHLLYAVVPGIRDYLEFGGAGVVVFDMDKDHAFVKRIATPASGEDKPDNIKGVCACAKTGRLYFTTTKRLYCLDLASEKPVWDKALPQGCDRMSITPDGKTLYVPSLEKDIWNVVDGASGDVVATVETKSGAHNTVVGLDGSRMYLAGLRSPLLSVADTKTHKVVQTIGPFSAAVRPFTVNADQSLCFVTVNGLLGFEIGDLKTGKKLQRVLVQGFSQGVVKRHGCPSHGIGLTPDEREIWVCDAANSRLHVFDATVMPPKQVASVKLREQPGWVTFSLDGRFAYPSTGDVIDVKTRRVVAGLTDETGRQVHSEKMVEIVLEDGKPVRNGDQFGVGRRAKDSLDTVKDDLASKKAVLVDVREKSEWDAGHLASAIFVPLSELSAQAKEKEYVEKLSQSVPKDKIVYCHCRSGRRAQSAAEVLKKLGYDVRPLKQGYEELLKAGFPAAK